MPATPEPGRREQSILAFDFGRRRIGVAVGQTLTRSASPLDTEHCRDGAPDWPALDRLVEQWRPDQLVVGLPLHADDSDSALSRAARAFAADLQTRYSLPVALQDERLSSSEARSQLKSDRRSGALKRRSRKEDVDRLAAAVILQSWFDERINHGGHGEHGGK